MRISSKLLNLINSNKSFLLVTHINPEGDAVGSTLALALGLKRMGKNVYVLDKDPIPKILKFLPSSELFKQKAPRRVFDVLFLVDCNTIKRTGFKNLSAKKIAVIDHHILPAHNVHSVQDSSLSATFVDSNASATGELVYKLLLALKVPVDKKIATNLYTSILVDTGGFRYANTTSESLRVASLLVEAGAEPWEITKEVYENMPFNTMRLLALASSTLEKRGRIAWMTVTKDMFKETGTGKEDTEDFVNIPRKIGGIDVAIFFREDGNGFYKVSLRSKGMINVAKIAEKFDGGGHAVAAGCKLNGSLKEVKAKVFRAVKKAIIKK